jgi:hypothetical protein
MQTSPAIETEDKDLPLREDIRLLGRILGDTIREQSGGAVFDTVENIRQNSVRFRRDEDLTARRDILAPFEAAERRAISDSQRMVASVRARGGLPGLHGAAIFARANDLGRVDDPFVWAGLLIPACLAGCWIGVCLGYRGVGRAMFRGILVGALEGAALIGLVKEAINQPEAIKWAVALMYLNSMLFWYGQRLPEFQVSF